MLPYVPVYTLATFDSQLDEVREREGERETERDRERDRDSTINMYIYGERREYRTL